MCCQWSDLSSCQPSMQQSIIRYHPGHALPTRTVTCILLYICHSDLPITSCHLMHIHLPLLLEVSVLIPLDPNNIHIIKFVVSLKMYSWNSSPAMEQVCYFWIQYLPIVRNLHYIYHISLMTQNFSLFPIITIVSKSDGSSSELKFLINKLHYTSS